MSGMTVLRNGLLALTSLVAFVLLGVGVTSQYYQGYWFVCDECGIRSLSDAAEVLEVGWVTYLVDEDRFEHNLSISVADETEWWERCSGQGLLQMRRSGLSLPPEGAPISTALYKAAFERLSPKLFKAARESLFLAKGREVVGRRANIHGWVYRVRNKAGDDVLAWELWAITAPDHEFHEVAMVSNGRLLESKHFVVRDWPVEAVGGIGGLVMGCFFVGLVPQLLNLRARRSKRTR